MTLAALTPTHWTRITQNVKLTFSRSEVFLRRKSTILLTFPPENHSILSIFKSPNKVTSFSNRNLTSSRLLRSKLVNFFHSTAAAFADDVWFVLRSATQQRMQKRGEGERKNNNRNEHTHILRHFRFWRAESRWGTLSKRVREMAWFAGEERGGKRDGK